MLSLTALIKTILNASIRRGIWVPMLVTYFALAFFVSFVHKTQLILKALFEVFYSMDFWERGDNVLPLLL